jgi:hypothetical protein
MLYHILLCKVKNVLNRYKLISSSDECINSLVQIYFSLQNPCSQVDKIFRHCNSTNVFFCNIIIYINFTLSVTPSCVTNFSYVIDLILDVNNYREDDGILILISMNS